MHVTDENKNLLEELVETKLKKSELKDKKFVNPHYIFILEFNHLYGLCKHDAELNYIKLKFRVHQLV